jgi:ADP-dependent NAD(P)H-hydrate dehydratase / NAD(P)H-hydrate epimerase
MKVVTPLEMQKIESASIANGYSAAHFMDKAAIGIVAVVESFIDKNFLPKQVLLLAGNGHNGGDAYTVGSLLLTRGFSVEAFSPTSITKNAPLCLERFQQFIQDGGKLVSTLENYKTSVIVDGLLGTGFQGEVAPEFVSAIAWANDTRVPILSIDIPSGLCGFTGVVSPIAIRATITMFLALPKVGFFIGQGPDYIGHLVPIDFGLPSSFIDGAIGNACLIEQKDVELPPIVRSRHKYQAGYVLGLAGSFSMQGAAVLSTAAALRSGSGIVRLFSDVAINLLPEIIYQKYDIVTFEQEAKRACAYFVGPGLGKDTAAHSQVESFLSKSSVVFDADALYFLAKNPQWKIPPNSILTPHKGELIFLLGKEPDLESVQIYADLQQVTVIWKGFPTIIFHPQELPSIVMGGDGGMATAGSGDVLTGMVASFLAQRLSAKKAAIAAVYFHALAGSLAAKELSSYCLIASSILDYLPQAIVKFQQEESKLVNI